MKWDSESKWINNSPQKEKIDEIKKSIVHKSIIESDKS